jgi:hypothetical protein
LSLNIKNPQTTGLIRELAAIRGVSLTAAVKDAVQSEIDRQKLSELNAPRAEKKSRIELLREYAASFDPLFVDGRTGNDLINDLYDNETGLPK